MFIIKINFEIKSKNKIIAKQNRYFIHRKLEITHQFILENWRN